MRIARFAAPVLASAAMAFAFELSCARQPDGSPGARQQNKVDAAKPPPAETKTPGGEQSGQPLLTLEDGAFRTQCAGVPLTPLPANTSEPLF